MKDRVLPGWLDPARWVNRRCTAGDVAAALNEENPDEATLAALLSPAARDFIEPMARKARELTRRHFGRTVSLYAPLYLSNYCVSGCAYCGFASDRKQKRRRLDLRETEAEMIALRAGGIEEILLLTGERCPEADFEYLKACVELAAKRFHLVTVESFSMSEAEYAELAAAGCSGVTLYQETYDPDCYARAHRWGVKTGFAGRLEAPERALSGGIRFFGLGCLIGLSDHVFDALALFRHARRLMKTHWRAGLSLSFPRLCAQEGGFEAPRPADDKTLARMIFAFRICLPDTPLVLSTREKPSFRDGMAGLGISKMSVASRTTVGGYTRKRRGKGGQFDVNDNRGVEEFGAALRKKGLEPVFKNWDAAYRESSAG